MSEQNSDEQGVKATVILSAATVLMGAVLGAVSLAGESGLWPSFSRERAYTEQAALGPAEADDTLNDYSYSLPAQTRGATHASEVVRSTPREGCSAQPHKQLAKAERRGEAPPVMRASAALRDRAARDKSPARAVEVAVKVVDKGLSGRVGEGGSAVSRHLKVVVRALPEVARQTWADADSAESPAVESAHTNFGSPYKCLKGHAPPSADKSAGPAGYVAREMIDRRQPALYLVPLLAALGEAAADETPKAEEAEASEDEAGEATSTHSSCTGVGASAAESVESPGGESDASGGYAPRRLGCDAETRQED